MEKEKASVRKEKKKKKKKIAQCAGVIEYTNWISVEE